MMAPGIHVTHGSAKLVGQHDEHKGRRNDLRQRTGRRDDAGGQ